MIRSSCRIGALLLGLTASLAACGEECDRGKAPMRRLQPGTYRTADRAHLSFPGSGIEKKTMVYDDQTRKLTITYTYKNKNYVETWMVASSSTWE